MIVRIFTIVALLVLSFAPGALAADRMRLVSVPLDMPMSDNEALDNQALEGLYQGDYGKSMAQNFGGYLGDNVKSSGLNESPYYHIDTVLKDGRKLQLWFSSAADGRKVFGVHLETPYIEKPTADFKRTLAELQSAWGKPDVQLPSPVGNGAQQILIYVDRAMPKDRYEKATAHLPAADKLKPADVENLWRSDLPEWVRILGPEFRGAIAIVSDQGGKLAGEQVLLIDLERAGTVFNLGARGSR